MAEKTLQERFDEIQTALHYFILNVAVEEAAKDDGDCGIGQVRAFDIDPEKDSTWCVQIKWHHRPDKTTVAVWISGGEVEAEVGGWS